MYSAKALGKGRYEIFDADMRANTIARLQLETELRRGIERKEFENYYQVIVNLNTGKIWDLKHCFDGSTPREASSHPESLSRSPRKPA